MATEQNNDPELMETEVPAVNESQPTGDEVLDKPWYRRGSTLAILALVAAAVVAALVFVTGRDSSTSSSSRPPEAGETIQSYFEENNITVTPVTLGEEGAPAVTFALPRGWSDAGPDTPEGAYGAAFYDASADEEYPTSLVVLLSKLSDDADAGKILEYAPGELQNLPGYKAISKPKASTMSGFDAVQLGGLYTKDGNERIIAQKTVVIPSPNGLYVLQMNVNGPKEEAAVVQEATAVLDEQAKIAP